MTRLYAIAAAVVAIVFLVGVWVFTMGGQPDDKFAQCRTAAVAGGTSQIGGPFTLIDESYNANPASMRAALEALGQARPEGKGRRIAVIGDMLELGDDSIAMHRGLIEPIKAADVDLVFASGPHMRELFKALPQSLQGAYAETSDELGEALREAVEPGDVVMVKGSLGSRMGPLVDMLRGLGDDEGESIRRNRGGN